MTLDKALLTEPVKLDYATQGKKTGIPLLLIHGFPLSRAIWDEQLPALLAHAYVITPDLRGHGDSPAPDGAYNMPLFVKDLLGLLDELGVEKAIWAGHSMGGYITLAGWRLAPERFLGLGLVASHHLADSEEKKQARHELAEQVQAEGSAAAQNPNLFAEATPKESPLRQKVHQIVDDAPPNGVVGSLLSMASRRDSTDLMRSITVPTSVIAGAEDKLLEPEIAEAAAELCTNADLTMIANAGHMVMMEQPRATNAALLALVQRVRDKLK
jgi:pimeloyl-ACP methyl ester carboxylesterase